MKKFSKLSSFLLAVFLLGSVLGQATSFSVPKRELRSAWVATVWALDWPTIGAEVPVQKEEMVRLLDSLKNNNFNAVNFQVRSMCDAMYKSSYEPWSSYLTGKRGQAPGYDPLQFVIDECHKRGMECHAWVNPYRFSTGSKWNTPQDQDLKNGNHLLTYGSTIILDPAQQWTIDRIVNVCKELVSNYDLDGILYDDYFYPNGIPANSSADDYQEYIDSGTSMSMGDWRRDNVNRMVKAVYDMIQAVKPYIRFGISPAGVAATSASVAGKYGVSPCPAGSDWQYNGIFSDPLAWISNHTIDFISPQVYWPIGASADYGKITPWWNQVSAKFGRHCYISSSISNMQASSTALDYAEYANEVELNRTSSVDGNPGAIFYSCKFLYKTRAKQSLANYLKTTVFTKNALPPVMTWKTGSNPGTVNNLNRVANKLSWTGYDNVRYSVYAFPATMKPESFMKQVDYLLGMSYSSECVVPEEYLDGNWQFAVCVVDRVGNEYDPAFIASNLPQLSNPVLVTPENGVTIDAPFNFTWKKVDGATNYTVELSNDSTMGNIVESVNVTDTTLQAIKFDKLEHQKAQYWRVQAFAQQHYSGISETRSFTPKILTVLYPLPEEDNVVPNFTAQWYNVGSSNDATVEIATTDTFAAGTIVFTGKSATGQLPITGDALEAGNTYYLRVLLTVDGQHMVSKTIRFTIAHSASTFITPVDGGVIYKGQHIAVKPQSWSTSYVIEISSSKTTWGRTRFVETLRDGATQSTLPADSIKVSRSYLTDGKTYYARTKTTYTNLDGTANSTAFGDTIMFTYRAIEPPKGDINHDGVVNVSDVTELINMILGTAPVNNDIADLNGDGLVNVSDVTKLINMILGN